MRVVGKRAFDKVSAILKVLLCVVLVVSLCPPFVGAFAEEPDPADVAQSVSATEAASEAEGEDETSDAANEPEDEAAAAKGEAAGKDSEAGSDSASGKATSSQESDEESATDTPDADSKPATDADSGEPAATAEPASSSTSAQLDGATMLKAKAKGIRATLLVDASAELPAGAKLVITPLMKHKAANADGDAAEASSEGESEDADDETADELDGSESIDSEGEALETQDEPEAIEDAADDEAAYETGDETPAVATEKATGAQAALAGIAKAVQAYRAKKGAAAATVVDAYSIEVVDAQGNVVPVDDAAAKLTVTLEDGDEDVADYDKVYAVERDAEGQQSVSEAAETEYADEDAVEQAVPYQGEATDVTESAKTDEQAEETTVELDGVRSIATTTEEAASDDATATDQPAATTTPKAKANGPRKAPPAKPATRATVDTNALGFTMNLFDYEVVDSTNTNLYKYDSGPNYGNGTRSGINSGKSRETQLKFYAAGDSVDNGWEIGKNPGNTINHFTGQKGDTYTEQYANQGIVKSELSGSGKDYSSRYPVVNTKGNDDKSTNYLFDPSSTYDSADKRTTYKNVNNLFYLQNQGTAAEKLVYNSNDVYAYYDVNQQNAKDGGDFKVYNGTYNRKGGDGNEGMMVGFFPFNDWWSKDGLPEINPYYNNGTCVDVDHHFGLTLNTPFTMPLDGTITYEHENEETGETDREESDLFFEFSGDDDMWVFVDGKLVLDVGGIHQPVRGNINFKTGVVQLSSGTKNPKTNQNGIYAYKASNVNADSEADKLVRGTKVYLWNVYGGDDNNPVFTNNGTTPTHKGIFGDRETSAWRAGTTHTLQAFYLERGGCDSNLEISTNIHLMAKRQASVQKEWIDTEDTDQTPVKVQLIRKATARDDGRIVGYSVVEEKQLDSTNGWTQKWKDLVAEGYNPTTIYYDEMTEDGTAATAADNVYCDYTYLVREVPLSGYTPTYYDSKGKKLPIEKVGKMDKAGVEVTYKKGTGSGSTSVTRDKIERGTTNSSAGGYTRSDIPLNEGNDWRFGIGNLTAFELNEGKYYDYVYKRTPDNDDVSFKQCNYHLGEAKGITDSAAIPSDFSTVTVKNEPIYLDVVKKWEGPDGNPDTLSHSNDAVWVQLYKQVKSANGTWGDAVPVGEAVKLSASDKASNDWKAHFKVQNGNDIRYFVKEGTANNDGSNFQELRTLQAAKTSESDTGTLYVHDETTYTRDGQVVNEFTETIEFSKIQGPVEQRAYTWTSGTGDNVKVTRTFDGKTELKQAGGLKQKYAQDTIQVTLTIPKSAEEMVDTSSANDYTATVTLPAELAPQLSGEEGGGSWDVSAAGVDATVAADATTKTVEVTVAAQTAAGVARANNDRTITLSIPVKPASGDDLSISAASTSIAVQQTDYQRHMFAGETTDAEKESTGNQYVSLPEGYTHADATISNKHVVTKLAVQKKWTGDAPEQSIWVQLKKDGVIVGGPVELKPTDTQGGDAKWTHTFANLEVSSGRYTVVEGTMVNGVFQAIDAEETFKLTEDDDATVYEQKGIVYYDADDEPRQTVTPADSDDTEAEDIVTPIEYLDGYVVPDAGKAVITNGPAGADIQLLKVDADSTSDPKEVIVGAKFQLYKDAGELVNDKPVYVEADDKVADNLVLGEEDATEFVTGEDGTIAFPSLQAGTYWLLETAAPAGWLVRDPAHPIGITVNDDSTVELIADAADTDKSRPVLGEKDDNGIYTLTVPDMRAYALPASSGPGLMAFLFAGAFLMALAAGLRRRNRESMAAKAPAGAARGFGREAL